MHNGAKTALVAVISVVIAAALLFAGVLLGMNPGVGSAVRDFFGWNYGSDVEVDSDLQQEILEKLESTYYKEVDPETVAVGAIDGMLASVGDPYTIYYDPEEYAALKEETSGSYSGVGMTVQMSDRLVTVISVFEESPAEAAQIRKGDIVVSVDGVSTSGRTLEEVVADIKGPEGTTVALEMYRPAASATTDTTEADGTAGDSEGETTDDTTAITVDLAGLPTGGVAKDYTLTRRSIIIPTTDTETLDASGKKVALIAFYTFNNEHASDELRSDVEKAIDQDKVDAIILDLRSNGGGLLDSAIEVAGIFIDSGVIVSTEGLHSPEQVYSASGEAYEDVPLYVLTDPYTASASEIVAGALQDYGRATIVGETTFGKGLVQSIEPLSNGGALKVTTAVYLTPKGRDINAKGVSPDIVAPDDPETETVDETVETVLHLISGQSAGR
jgi:carboxyl-terminal processing protease